MDEDLLNQAETETRRDKQLVRQAEREMKGDKKFLEDAYRRDTRSNDCPSTACRDARALGQTPRACTISAQGDCPRINCMDYQETGRCSAGTCLLTPLFSCGGLRLRWQWAGLLDPSPVPWCVPGVTGVGYLPATSRAARLRKPDMCASDRHALCTCTDSGLLAAVLHCNVWRRGLPATCLSPVRAADGLSGRTRARLHDRPRLYARRAGCRMYAR